MLKIAILSGSSRPDSQSGKVATYLQQQLQQRGEQACVLDLAVTPLPLWPAGPAEHWPAMQAQLVEADALVVIAPEWHGMACPAVKNFFLYASKAELAHKPALLVGVSSGIGGAYPISELRASGYKNCRLCYLPEHLIIRQVEQVLNAGTALVNELGLTGTKYGCGIAACGQAKKRWRQRCAVPTWMPSSCATARSGRASRSASACPSHFSR